jgi:hypothetical protein
MMLGFRTFAGGVFQKLCVDRGAWYLDVAHDGAPNETVLDGHLFRDILGARSKDTISMLSGWLLLFFFFFVRVQSGQGRSGDTHHVRVAFLIEHLDVFEF